MSKSKKNRKESRTISIDGKQYQESKGVSFGAVKLLRAYVSQFVEMGVLTQSDGTETGQEQTPVEVNETQESDE